MRRVTSDVLILRVRGGGEHELEIATMSGRTMAEASSLKIAGLHRTSHVLSLSESTAVHNDAGAVGDQLVLRTDSTPASFTRALGVKIE